ncbi:agamous MADS-box protein [Salix suchowensis]|nr:agamous MADS-box protein [Salix suchowensis]
MGRNKLPLKKIDNPCRRKITYSKRRDGIIKKATELSVLCDTDVGVLMYSPHGRLTTFSSNGSIEDIFLRYFDQSSEQGGTVEKEGVLMEKVNEIRQKLQERREKMRSYNPDVVDINAILDANAHRQFLFDAIQNIEKLGMEIFHEPIDLQKSESLQVTLPATRDAHLTANELVYANGNRNLSQDDHQPKEAHLPVGPHLTLEYLRTQKHWNLQGRGQGNA